jgi:hypothetical protein
MIAAGHPPVTQLILSDSDDADTQPRRPFLTNRRMLNGASYNDPRTFLQTHEYKNLTRWTKEIGERPAVKRGRMVNRTSGPPEEQLHERHDASDFRTKTQDKIGARG